jgi:TolB-like protein/Tfp pilus assembly protein PilF
VSLVAELKRRNVIRMAGLYLVGAWLIVQVASTVFPAFEMPGWALRGVILLLAIGFIPALVLSWIFELTPAGLKRDGDVLASESIAPQTARRMDRMIIVVLLVALAYLAADKFVLAPMRAADKAAPAPAADAGTHGWPRTETASVPASIHPKSIAVLAFANMSADKDNEYFSDGVAEEILNALAQVRDMKVAGRTSSFYFKGRNEDVRSIGKALGVAHVLEGSVRKQGRRLRITAQLLRASDGFRLWSQAFDGDDDDIFALQESIARKVATELEATLDAGQQGRLVDAGTGNPDAYALYLRASDVFNRRDFENYGQAIQSLQQAVRLDPGFARARSRLAAVFYVLAGNSSSDRYRGFIDQATSNAEMALQLDPTLAEPHAVLGVVKVQAREYANARAALTRALQLDPGDATANLWFALLHCQTGYITECERGLDGTLEIDPLLPNALNWRARLWVSAGDVDKAERMIARAREVGLGWPGSVTQAWIARQRGDLPSARKYSLEVYQALAAGLAPNLAADFAAASYGDAQAIARSKAAIDDYLADGPSTITPLVPMVLVRISEIERALQVFAGHRTSNDPAFLGDTLGTRLNPEVWASPGFPEFLRKTGIAAYWDGIGPPSHCRKDANGDYRCQ